MKRLIWGFTLLLLLALALWQRDPSKPDVTIIGPVQTSEGLGRQSIELMDAVKDKLRVTCVPTNQVKKKKLPYRIRKDLRSIEAEKGKLILFEECPWTPGNPHYEMLGGPKSEQEIRIAYTMFESTQIPDEWVEIFNSHFDAAAVPDPFLIPIYQACGVEIPLFVLPLGLNLQSFLSAPIKSAPGPVFTFGNLTACIERKNLTRLVEAFAIAFGDDPAVRLVINSRYSHPDTREELEKKIEELGGSNITFTQKCLSEEAYLEKFQEIDCYVSLSRGEGFSIQPREAMALGIPAIVTDNTGQKTIAASRLALPVSSGILRPSMNTFGTILKTPVQYGYDFDCSAHEAAAKMREVYQHYSYYKGLASEMRKWASSYDYSALVPLYMSLLHPKLLVLGEENLLTDEGITTSSSFFFLKWKRLFPDTPVKSLTDETL